MDASALKQTIETYEQQVKQVEHALEASGPDNAELIELRDNLLEVIELTNESLLALTKAELLQSLDSSPRDAGSSKDEDDEYAAFQATMGGATTVNSQSQFNQLGDSESDSELSDHGESVISSNLDDIIGTCVMAPHSHSWGGYQYHNAAIIGLDADNGQVRVMFCQPTHISMKICPYHLQGDCKYSESNCRLSHGHLVDIDQLREYQPPDDRVLSVGDNCLAKFSEDDLWYRATVVDTHGEEFLQVLFEDYGEATHAIQRSDVIPLVNQSESSSNSSDEEDQGQTTPHAVDEDDVPSYLWKPSDGEQLAGWETHTKGIGSKLMAAMGYKSGQGLGKVSQGRVEPVPILKLPPGKSLDRIMALKERTGNKDMFDVMKRKHHKLKLSSPAQRPKKSADMFEYLNKSLGHGKKVDLTAYRKQRSKGARNEETTPAVISKHQLSKKTDKNVNIQVIKTEEEIAKVEKEMLSLKQRLEVNVSRRDTGGVKHLTDKLSNAEKYLATLKRSHKELNRHRGQREGRKKLMIF